MPIVHTYMYHKIYLILNNKNNYTQFLHLLSFSVSYQHLYLVARSEPSLGFLHSEIGVVRFSIGEPYISVVWCLWITP